MGSVPFGGPLGVFWDPQLNLRVEPRCFGKATVAFEPRDELANALRESVIKHAQAQIESTLRAGGSIVSIQSSPTFASAIAATTSAELGVAIEVELHLSLGEADVAAIQQATAEAARKHREAILAKRAAVEPPCSRITWSLAR